MLHGAVDTRPPSVTLTTRYTQTHLKSGRFSTPGTNARNRSTSGALLPTIVMDPLSTTHEPPQTPSMPMCSSFCSGYIRIRPVCGGRCNKSTAAGHEESSDVDVVTAFHEPGGRVEGALGHGAALAHRLSHHLRRRPPAVGGTPCALAAHRRIIVAPISPERSARTGRARRLLGAASARVAVRG